MSTFLKLTVIKIAHSVLSNMAFAQQVYEQQDPPRELATKQAAVA
jgi:hypothetical protein